jgi:hypothetical protein
LSGLRLRLEVAHCDSDHLVRNIKEFRKVLSRPREMGQRIAKD